MRKIKAELPTLADKNRPTPRRDPVLRPITETGPGGTPGCMIVVDERGIIQYFSLEAERLFGYQAAELFEQNAGMLIPPSDRDQSGGDFRRFLALDGHHVGVSRIIVGRHKDHSTFPMELMFREIRGRRERLFAGTIRDLTVRVDRERHVDELQTELFRVAQLGELDHLSSSLVRTVIQPLTEIGDRLRRGHDGLHGRDQESARLVMALLMEIAERASKMILHLRDILTSHIAEQRAEDLREIIGTACGLALAGVRQAVTLEVRVAANAAVAVIDKKQIQQVLLNLIRNAVRAMEASARREVVITTARVGDKVEVRVSDTGPGVAAGVRPRLFHPFVTAGGFGVGLSVCRAIVEAHGGEIRADDADCGGAMFRFTVPCPLNATESNDSSGRPYDAATGGQERA
jgi:two-component system sensor kinase FixL